MICFSAPVVHHGSSLSTASKASHMTGSCSRQYSLTVKYTFIVKENPDSLDRLNNVDGLQCGFTSHTHENMQGLKKILTQISRCAADIIQLGNNRYQNFIRD
ncbi:hypothetical protein ILYODFUR_008512 [Ilyodon furcidens]|uniref:Uncharacterized protein n=1 Tax=Ilyodon furcidens TaxID=33524 RepID=A0ABV0TH04_9TELE